MRYMTGFSVTAVMVALALDLGCSSGSSTVSLYVFDATTPSIKVWDDISAAYDTGALPDPSRTITGSTLSSVKTLAWGGMALDTNNNNLFLVSKTGTVIIIYRASAQNGDLTSNSDITQFTLSGLLQQATDEVGQISVDGSGTLYIAEGSDTGAKVWTVQSPYLTVAQGSIQTVSNDAKCYGIAYAGTSLFTYFGKGDSFTTTESNNYIFARLRTLSGTSFSNDSYPLTSATANKFGTIGSLAADTGNNYLFLCHRNADTSAPTLPPILGFRFGTIAQGLDQPPEVTLGDFATYPNLRFIAHAGNQPWLVAGEAVTTSGTTSGTSNIYLWKDPTNNPTTAPKQLTVPNGQVLGMAFNAN